MIKRIFSKDNDKILLTCDVDSQFAKVKIEQFDTIENNLIIFKQVSEFINDMQYIKWVHFINLGNNYPIGSNLITYQEGTTTSYHITDIDRVYHKNLALIVNIDNIYYNPGKEVDDNGWTRIVNSKKEKQLKLKNIKKQLNLTVDWIN